MQKYIDRFEKHPLFDKIRSARQIFAAVTSAEDEAAAREEADRIQLAFDYLEGELKACLPHLASINLLKVIEQDIDHVAAELTNYKQGKNAAHLASVNVHLDNANARAVGLPKPEGKAGQDSIQVLTSLLIRKNEEAVEATTVQKKKIDAKFQNLSEASSKAEMQIENLFKNIEVTKANLGSVVTEFQKQFSEAEAQRRKEFIERQQKFEVDAEGFKEKIGAQLSEVTRSVEAIKLDVVTIATEFQKQFSESEALRRKEFSERQQKLQMDIEDFKAAGSAGFLNQAKELKEGISKEMESLRSATSSLIEEIDGKNESAAKLLESVGGHAQTHEYSEVAATEGTTASWLRLGAVFFMFIAVAILILPPIISLWNLYLNPNVQQVDWEKIWREAAWRVPTVLIVFVPAFYLAREAAQHRKVAVENKRIQLELASLTSYMALFKPEEQQKVRESLIKSYFIGHSHRGRDETGNKYKEVFEGFTPKVMEKVISTLATSRDGKKESA